MVRVPKGRRGGVCPLGFQILTSVLAPDSRRESSLDSATVRMSERCPGASRLCRMRTSSSLMLHTCIHDPFAPCASAGITTQTVALLLSHAGISTPTCTTGLNIVTHENTGMVAGDDDISEWVRLCTCRHDLPTHASDNMICMFTGQ